MKFHIELHKLNPDEIRSRFQAIWPGDEIDFYYNDQKTTITWDGNDLNNIISTTLQILMNKDAAAKLKEKQMFNLRNISNNFARQEKEEANKQIQAERNWPYVRLGSSGDWCKVRLDKFDPNTIRVKDIAKGLAKRCRYGGSVDTWYSVAEHSILGSYLFHDDLQRAREFLIHDAAEYVFEDVMSPVVAMCPDYKAKRDAFQDGLFELFCGYPKPHPAIKIADNYMYFVEQHYLRGVTREEVGSVAEIHPLIHANKLQSFCSWPWYTAEIKFMERFQELFGRA